MDNDLLEATRLTAAVREALGRGRFLVAKNDMLEAGHEVYAGDAYAVGLHEEWVEYVCARCFTVSSDQLAVSCTQCKRAFYCSVACRDLHRQEDGPGTVAHRWVCEGWRALLPAEEVDVDHAHLRIALEILAQRHAPTSCEDQAGSLSPLPSHCDSAPRRQGGAVASKPSRGGTLAEEFGRLQHQLPNGADGSASTKEQQEGGAEGSALAKAVADAAAYHWCEDVREAVLACGLWAESVSSEELSDAVLLAIRDRVNINGFDCCTDVHLGASIGTCVYLGGATLFNHDCEPNCEVIHGVPSLRIRTTRSVSQEEPLTLAYVHTTDGRAERRKRLRHQYGFECNCRRCAAEAPRTPPTWLLEMHQRGTHYVVAIGVAVGTSGYGGFGCALLGLLMYFVIYCKVLRYPL